MPLKNLRWSWPYVSPAKQTTWASWEHPGMLQSARDKPWVSTPSARKMQPANLGESARTASLSSLVLWVLRPSSHLQHHPKGSHHWTPPGPPLCSRACSQISGHGWLGAATLSGETPSLLGLLILWGQMGLEEEEKRKRLSHMSLFPWSSVVREGCEEKAVLSEMSPLPDSGEWDNHTLPLTFPAG